MSAQDRGRLPSRLKKHLPNWEIFGCDLKEQSLAVARKNALRHGVEIHWMHSDLLKDVDGMFDAMAANLPYIPTKDIQHLSIGVQGRTSARSGWGYRWSSFDRSCGPAVISSALARWDGFSSRTGNAQEDEVRKLVANGRLGVESIWNDYQGIPRVIVARWD